jgi:hypothetical protein
VWQGTLVIPASQEADIGRIWVRGKQEQNVPDIRLKKQARQSNMSLYLSYTEEHK